MKDIQKIAENATIQSFLNCYLRETGNYQTNEADAPHLKDLLGNRETVINMSVTCPLSIQQVEIIVPIKYWSHTGRHHFSFPIYYQPIHHADPKQIDYITLVSLVVKELLLEQGQTSAEDEFMLRVILSCRNITRYLENRQKDAKQLNECTFDYIEAEQSLLFGHLLHPTPKSKQGITDQEEHDFSPEMKGEFQLHYFRAHESIVIEDSSIEKSASEIVKEVLGSNNATEIEKVGSDKYALIPAHPLQAKQLIKKREVKELLESKKLEYLGPLGQFFTATSSFRTVYNQQSKYMYKFSVPVKITNSLRRNLPKELHRGVEVSRLMNTEVGSNLEKHFKNFRIIQDPAYLNLDIEGEASGFEVVIRENPFYGHRSQGASLIAGLCQDHAYGNESRLKVIIGEIAKRENRSLKEVSLKWFDQYLSLSLDPILWLYETYGIALEAHQQNSIIYLKDGYPDTFYYRDNQGYYYGESKAATLMEHYPDLNRHSNTICADEIAEERLRYYFFINHLFGLISGFGGAELASEESLLFQLRNRLEEHDQRSSISSSLFDSLLNDPVLPCKANLLTRVHDMDELVGSLESQSIYTMIPNPMVQVVGSVYDK